MFHSIRWRIALPYTLLILVTMLVTDYYLSRYIRQTYIAALSTSLNSQAQLASRALIRPLSEDASPTNINRIANDWAIAINARVTVIAPDGIVLGDSHEDYSVMDNHLQRPEIILAEVQGVGSSTRFSQTTGYQMMYMAATIVDQQNHLGYVRVALPLSQVESDLAHIRNWILAVTLVTGLLAIILGTLVAGRTTRPLRALTEDVTQLPVQINDPDFSPKSLPLRSSDEIGRLTRAFNAMTSQLQEQIRTLETERGKIAAVLNEMTDGLLIVAQDGSILLINPAAERLFKVTQAEAIGHSFVEVVRHHELVDLWRLCLSSGQIQSTTLDLGLRQLYLHGTAVSLGEAMPGSTLLLFQDLTRMRQLETIRRDFISNISHELRTPLATLKALVDTLLEGALDDPPAARQFLGKMETELDSLSLMVSELLELVRIESGRVPLQLRAVSPCSILEQGLDRLRLQAERNHLELVFDCAAALPDVLADQTRMEQVVVNLLHNAIKFTPAGGKITVSAISLKDRVQICVRDTGIGIPSADLPRVFERFYKADRARSTGGTGLGLSIARHLVQAHGGEIWVESEEGRGSAFYFEIPLAT